MFFDKGGPTNRSSNWRDPLDDVRTMTRDDVEGLVEQHGELEAMSLIAQASIKMLKSVKLRVEETPNGRRLAMQRRTGLAGRREDVTQYEPTGEPAARWDASKGEYVMTPTRAGFSEALGTGVLWRALDRYSDERQHEIMEAWRSRFGDIRPTADELHEVARWLERRKAEGEG